MTNRIAELLNGHSPRISGSRSSKKFSRHSNRCLLGGLVEERPCELGLTAQLQRHILPVGEPIAVPQPSASAFSRTRAPLPAQPKYFRDSRSASSSHPEKRDKNDSETLTDQGVLGELLQLSNNAEKFAELERLGKAAKVEAERLQQQVCRLRSSSHDPMLGWSNTEQVASLELLYRAARDQAETYELLLVTMPNDTT